MYRSIRLGRLVAAVATVTVLSGGCLAATAASTPPRQISSCFWMGPASTKVRATNGFDGKNFNFPEAAATYWMAKFQLPAGARLELVGHYAHARYESLNAYDAGGVPLDSLPDISIRADRGSSNPFVAGHRRDLPRRKRSFRVTVLAADAPAAGRSANTLYAGSGASNEAQLIYRVYVPDRGET